MKKLYRIPMESFNRIVYHYVLAENPESILEHRQEIHEHFKGDGLLSLNTDRYQYWWYDDVSKAEYEI